MNQLAQMLKIGEEVFSPSRSGFENENGKKVKKKKAKRKEKSYAKEEN